MTLFCMVSVLFRADIRSVNLLLGEAEETVFGVEQFMVIDEPSKNRRAGQHLTPKCTQHKTIQCSLPWPFFIPTLSVTHIVQVVEKY